MHKVKINEIEQHMQTNKKDQIAVNSNVFKN